MRRSHRSVHRALWPVLALAVALGLALALIVEGAGAWSLDALFTR